MDEQTRKQNDELCAFVQDFAAQTAQFYDTLSDRPICTPADEDTLARLAAEPIPEAGRPAGDVCRDMVRDVYSGVMLAQHPRAFACVPSSASMLSWAGDVMTAAFNPHASCCANAPAADLIEKKLIRWACGLAGYPEGAGGLFVSGGSVANLTALTAARDALLPGRERADGVLYLSSQTHASVAKGAHIIGFLPEQMHIVPTDERFRMDACALREAIEADRAAGLRPFAVVASAGTTNTASVDPLGAIADLCEEFGLWMHVDGAYGASALCSPEQKKRLAGIERSNSLSWDAHKWLQQTYSCSMVLVRDRQTLFSSFNEHPEYLKDAGAGSGVEFWDLGPELTRPARALKLYLTLCARGTRAIADDIDHSCRMAEFAERELRSRGLWQIVSPAQLGVVCFRAVPDGYLSPEAIDALQSRIAQDITSSGFAQVYTTELCGRKVLRLCMIHPETTERDVVATVERLSAAAARMGTRRPVSVTA